MKCKYCSCFAASPEDKCVSHILNPYMEVISVSDKSLKRYVGMMGRLVDKVAYDSKNFVYVLAFGEIKHLFYSDEIVRRTI